MNLGLVTSFIIAGVLLVSILMMNLNLSTSSSELTVTQINRQHISTVSEMLSYDIPKIGYSAIGKVSSIDNPGTGVKYNMITEASNNKITFNSDIDNNGTIDLVSWEFTSTPVSTTQNPNDYILIRKQGTDETKITLGITRFEIQYYNETGKPEGAKMATPVSASSLEDIKQIEIKLVLQSGEEITYRLGNNSKYISSAWEKRFTPINLQ